MARAGEWADLISPGRRASCCEPVPEADPSERNHQPVAMLSAVDLHAPQKGEVPT